MSKLINFGSREPLEVTNRNIEGINIALNLTHTTADVALVTADCKLDLITVDVKLERGGKTYPLLFGNLRDLVSFSNYDNQLFEGVRDFTKIMRTVREGAGGLTQMVIVPMVIDFGGVINLRGSDKIVLTVEASAAAITNNVNSSVSKVFFEYKDGIGLEFGTPYTRVAVVPVNQTNPSFPMGNNVTKAILINYNLPITDYLDATRPVSSVTLKSDKLNYTKLIQELLGDQYSEMPDANGSPVRGQSWLLHDGTELDNARVELSLIAENVLANSNVLVYRYFFVDERLSLLAQTRAIKHSTITAKKWGLIKKD